jgi:hypothetical protein
VVVVACGSARPVIFGWGFARGVEVVVVERPVVDVVGSGLAPVAWAVVG